MELVDTFTGRWHPSLRAPVEMRMYYNAALSKYCLILTCGYKSEQYPDLTESEAITKWVANKKWWA